MEKYLKKKQVLLMVGIFILGFAFAFCAGIIKQHCSVIEWNGSTYNIENVNALDANFACPYNEKLDDTGDLILSLTCMGSLLIVFISFLISKNKRVAFKEAVFEIYVFCISFLYSNAVYRILKTFAGRIRPYMYFANPSQKGITTGDFCLSWPSGHSANCFNIIAFVVFWFVLRHSDSKLKKPFIVLFFMAGITVMVLRMLSGNHFLTDVLSGTAIGFVCGFSMDFLCNKIFAKKMEEL